MTTRSTYIRGSEWDRFWPKVDASGDCWLWTGAINEQGYGLLRRSGSKRNVRVHRWAWEALIGPIPEGLTIDHRCRVRNCLNPDHLEPVTFAVNAARGVPGNRTWRTRITHCPQGHEYTEANTYRHTNKRGITKKSCRTCRNKS